MSRLPYDWIMMLQAPQGDLKHALKVDGETGELNRRPYLSPKASYIKMLIVYASAFVDIVGVGILIDSTSYCISSISYSTNIVRLHFPDISGPKCCADM